MKQHAQHILTSVCICSPQDLFLVWRLSWTCAQTASLPRTDTTCLSSKVLNKGQWAVTCFKPRADSTGVNRLCKEQKDCLHLNQVYCAALCENPLHTEGHWTDKLKATRQTDRGPLDRQLLDKQRTARQPLKGQTNLWAAKNVWLGRSRHLP